MVFPADLRNANHRKTCPNDNEWRPSFRKGEDGILDQSRILLESYGVIISSGYASLNNQMF